MKYLSTFLFSTLPKNLRHVQLKQLPKEPLYDFISHSFVTYQPITNGISLSKNQFIISTSAVVGKCVQSKYSTAIVDQDNTIASLQCNLPYDQYLSSPSIPQQMKNQRIKTLQQILSDCGMIYSPSVEHSKIMYIFLIATNKKYKGMGLASYLMKHVVDQARKDQFKELLADATGPISQNILYKQGFISKGGMNYKRFAQTRKRPLAASIKSQQLLRLSRPLV